VYQVPNPGSTQHVINVWERRLLRILQDAELDAGTPASEFSTSPTLRQVADRLSAMSPEQYDTLAVFSDLGLIGQVWCFSQALARVLDRLAD
jgi:hypothetical protein